MDPRDDPEERIRELEQPLSDMARTSELGRQPTYEYVPPPPGSDPLPPTLPHPGGITYPAVAPAPPPATSRLGVLVPVVIAVVALGVAGVVTYVLTNSTSAPVSSYQPSIGGGGATLDDRPTPRAAPGASVETPAPGTSTSISGIGENRTLACDENTVSVSGFDNTVVLTGRCASVTVSGKDNVVTLDASATISVSGFDNRIVFHTGEPDVTNSGFGNTVEQG